MFPHACSPGRQRALGCLVDTIRRTALQGCLKVFNWTSASTANEAQVNTEGQGYRAHWTQHCVCFERQHRVYKQKHSDVVQPSLQNSTAGSRAQIISFRIRFIVSTEATEQRVVSDCERECGSMKNKHAKNTHVLTVSGNLRLIKYCIGKTLLL